MNPDRWGQIKQIYHSALELEPGRREEFLREACAGDTSLLKEVTSLLAQDRSPDGILQRPALEVVAQESGEGKEHKALLAGRTLLHYRIEEKIGQGGMGEVYRARDTSLDRTVALKILPAAFVSDQDRMRRFEREAKAASALSHQNVATIFGVGQAEGVHFIAMEYVSGETLGEYSRNRKLEPGQIFDIAIQMADTLEEAQAKGVIHRDLKPANVMVTARGQVKVLDFGLAKLARPAGEPGETSPSSLTESGLVIGTVAYMSPEQVLGRRLDHHTDIFSLGTILYELATGHSPFAGRTTTEMMDRILHAEPEPIARFNPRVPPEFERIVRKCLEKDSERRYQSARELQIDLQNLKRELEPRAQGVHAPRRSFVPAWIPGIVAAVILTVIGGWYWMNRQPRVEPEAELRPVPLTSYPGFEHTPSFSPDGTQVAFQWYPQGPRANCDIWVKQIGVEPPFRLTTDPAEDLSPAWSPDGRFIAFLRRVSPAKAKAMFISQRGGRERLMGESDLDEDETYGPYTAWTPDSKWLVFPARESAKAGLGLVMLSVDTLEQKRLTTCPAGSSDTGPAFSPDGRTLAFTRRSPNATGIWILRLGNNYEPLEAPERTLPGRFAFGPAWTPDGSDILFSSTGGLWRIPALTSGTPQRLAFASDAFRALAVSRNGNRLAYAMGKWETNIWRIVLAKPGLNPGTPSKLISSTRLEAHPAFSRDGKKISFYSNRSGSGEIWVCDPDGSNAAPLTSLDFHATGDNYFNFPSAWSPDGRRIAFGYHPGQVFVVNTNGGVPWPLSKDTDTGQTWPCWSGDGRWIYFRSQRSGSSEIWKVPAAGGDAIRMTSREGDLPQESPDGKFLYYMKGNRYREQCSVWRMPTGGGEETRVLDSTTCYRPYAVAEQGIYFFREPDEKDRAGENTSAQVDLWFLTFATGDTRKVRTIDQAWVGHMAVSPDGRTILYTQSDQEEGSDLMLVENFR